MICENIPAPKFFIFSEGVPPLLYYSHLTTLIVSIIIGFVIFLNRKQLGGRILLSIIIVYSVFIISNLVVWTNINSETIMFFWSLFGLINALLAGLLFYLSYVFICGRDLSSNSKLIFTAIILPIVIFSGTKQNISGFDLDVCGVADMEGKYFTMYYYGLGILSLISILFVYVRHVLLERDLFKNLKNLIFVIGTLSLILLFFGNGLLVSYLVEKGILKDYSFEMYGLFGMIIFFIVIAFLIVRYRAFDIKLLATQALIWTLIILVGSQFFFIRNPINYVLNGITFVGAIISGIMIVRSVKRVDAQREQLALANQEQETLVHFITHQIKGFFTKSRNIFDTLTDMENVPEGAQRLITEGLRSDKEGVELVENILNAANMKTGKMKFDNKEIDLDAVIKKVLSETNDAVAVKKLKLNYYCSTAPVKFMGDEFRLRDVFKNLIQNSINYTFEGGVTIYLNKKPDHIEFIVQDTGVGLTEDDKKKLFTSGGRGVESVKYNVSSTGYGLFIVKKVIDNYNGRIWAESEGRNKGSKFTLILPLV